MSEEPNEEEDSEAEKRRLDRMRAWETVISR